jgi:hypothetical protein
MKIPDIFVPDKNLDVKTERLKEFEDKGSIEVTLEELMKDDKFILYGEATFSKRDEIVENAISKIIKDTFENNIIWEEDTNLYEYKAKATILNYKKNLITIPVVFVMSKDIGYLNLGDKQGPCRNTYVKKVKQLAIEYFKMNPKDLL